MNRHALILAQLLAGASLLAIVLWGCNSSTTPPNPGPYGVIKTYAGNGVQGQGVDGVAPTKSPLYWPQDISFGPDGRAYIVDWNNYRIRVVENGIIRTIIGSGNPVPDGESEAPTGIATQVDLNHPTHVNFDANGDIILCGFHSSAVFLCNLSTNIISPICGNGVRNYGGDGGPASSAIVNLPVCSHYDSAGNLYIMDQANQRLRKIDTSGTITTVLGYGTPVPGGFLGAFSGDGGPPSEAQINLPIGQQAYPAGKFAIDSQDRIYIADTNNERIRMIANGIITTVAGNGTPGYGGDGGPATDAELYHPNSVAVDADGNIFISDSDNHCIRKVDTSGIITTFAGHPGQWCPRTSNCPPNGPALTARELGDGGNPRDAYLYYPKGISLDAEGNLYIADQANNRIRVVLKNP
jgi:NHL repeat-containing protein